MIGKECRPRVNFPLSNIREGNHDTSKRYSTCHFDCHTFLSPTTSFSVACTEYKALLPKFFRLVPSIRPYFKILRALKKLKVDNYQPVDNTIEQFRGNKTLSNNDADFNSLIILLKVNSILPQNEQPQELTVNEYIRTRPSASLFPERIQWLSSKINGEDRVLIYPKEIDLISELKEMADNFVRGKIATNIAILAILLFILNIALNLYIHWTAVK